MYSHKKVPGTFNYPAIISGNKPPVGYGYSGSSGTWFHIYSRKIRDKIDEWELQGDVEKAENYRANMGVVYANFFLHEGIYHGLLGLSNKNNFQTMFGETVAKFDNGVGSCNLYTINPKYCKKIRKALKVK